ncbi:FecR family protein [Phnomibacter sp. MR]|uniref:FecR family protein n=1 Tax=Phnomibacter sp. MR TaxID=3042318 RepID=UPI003A811112
MMSSGHEEKEPQLPFSVRRDLRSQEHQASNWQQIEQALDEEVPVRSISTAGIRRVAQWAAAAAIVLATSWALYTATQKKTLPEEYTIIKTAFGEKRKVWLPDSSIVILNGNSELKVPKLWLEDTIRTVWLQGEGYFEITKAKTPGKDFFVVHTNSMDVKVLGTKFNINAYTDNASVALKEGKVQVLYTGKNNDGKSTIYEMKPGDVVQLQTAATAPLLETTPTETVADWASNEYHFDYTTLKDIGVMIEQRFGYRMVWEDSQLAERTLNGHMHAINLDELINALEVTLNINIEKKDQRLLVTAR